MDNKSHEDSKLSGISVPFAGFVFCADTHLRDGLWSSHLEETRDDAGVGFFSAVDVAIRAKLPLIVGGDIFDKNRPDPASVALFNQAAAKLRRAGLPLLFIQGNHDWASTPWPLTQQDSWVTHVDKTLLKFEGSQRPFNVYCLDYRHGPALEAELKAAPHSDILIAHQSWDCLAGFSADGHVDQVRSSVLLSGDWHKTVIKRVQGAAGCSVALSPGSTCLLKTDEDVQKYCCVVVAKDRTSEYLSPGSQRSSSFDPVDFWMEPLPLGRSALRFNVTCEAELAEVVAAVRDVASKASKVPAVVVHVGADTPGLEKAVRKALTPDVCLLFVRPLYADRITVDQVTSLVSSFVSLEQLVETEVPDQSDRALMLGLLSAENKAEYLRGYISTYMESELA